MSFNPRFMMFGFDIGKIIKLGRKEVMRNEKIIRGLMKLPPNQRCINCNSLGTQYVCTNFWTFVCMTCSEIHREFTHRVKSVSMEKFTSQEVEALQKGGNQRARERYLKAWDPQRQRLPDNSHVDEVREFIKTVYVDEKYVVDTQNAKCHEDETRLDRKEVERNEKIIRGLTKLPPNQRCINCNNLGTHYVCTNFWTFVCITCSGIHREFTHHVKSVSMAKFTSQEVEALQKGGNQRAREIYLKAWDPQRQRLPKNSNFDNGRKFIKNVYVDEMYTMENSSYRPPRDTQNAEGHENETRQASSYGSYSPSDDHLAYEYRFAYEGSSPPVSEPLGSDVLSRSSQKDTPSPFSETSPSVVLLHHMVSHNPATYNKRDGGRMLYPQSTASSGSVGSVDGSSMSSKSVYSFNFLEVASESHQSAKTSHTKLSSLPSVSERSASENSDGLYLLSSPFSSAQYVDLFQQSPTSSAPTFVSDQHPQTLPSSSLDLFAEMHDQQQWSAGSNRKISDVVSKNEGWATFDMPLNTSSMGTETSIPAIIPTSDRSLLGSIDPYSQGSSDHQPSREMSTLWHESAQDFEANAEATRAQSTASSRSVGSVDGSSMSSKSVYSFNFLDVASESNQSTKTSHTKLSSLPSVSERSVSENSDDLFAEMPDQPQWSAGSNRKISDVVSKNEGWATFDMPPNTSLDRSRSSLRGFGLVTISSHESKIPPGEQGRAMKERAKLLGNIDPYSQVSSDHQPSQATSTLWHESAQDFEANAEATRAQSWYAFEDSKGEQSIDNTVKSSEPVTTNHTSDANQDLRFSIYEVPISSSVLSRDFHTLPSVVCSISLVEPSCTNDYCNDPSCYILRTVRFEIICPSYPARISIVSSKGLEF